MLLCRRKSEEEAKSAQEEIARLHGELEVVQKETQELVEAATPFVDSLVPSEGGSSEDSFLVRLPRSSDELRGYIRDTANTCVLHVLSIVRALKPDQDMAPFATGNVTGKSEEEFALLKRVSNRWQMPLWSGWTSEFYVMACG